MSGVNGNVAGGVVALSPLHDATTAANARTVARPRLRVNREGVDRFTGSEPTAGTPLLAVGEAFGSPSYSKSRASVTSASSGTLRFTGSLIEFTTMSVVISPGPMSTR